MALAIFDLDNTLIDCDSDYEWGKFLVSKNLVDAEEYAKENAYHYEEYKKGTLDVIEYSAFSFKPLAERTMDELSSLHEEFMQEVIIPLVKPKSFDLINTHKNNNDTLMIITATNSFITKPIAEYLGIHILLAIEPKIINGRYTTEVEGVPTFQYGKVLRLNDWIKANNDTLEGSIFYTDSHNDMSLMEVVDTPVAVDPDEELLKIATHKQWKVMSLR